MNKDPYSLNFKAMLPLSVVFALMGVSLCYNHEYAWSLLGDVGLKSLLYGTVLAVAFFVVSVYLVSHRLLRLPSFYNLISELHPLLANLSAREIIVLSVLAGIGEELIFRGALQSWLAGSIGVYSAIVVSSLIFGLFHAMSMYYFLFTFIMSLFLGALFHWSQSMLMLMVLHGVYDIIALTVIVKYPHWLGVTIVDNDEKNSKNEFVA